VPGQYSLMQCVPTAVHVHGCGTRHQAHPTNLVKVCVDGGRHGHFFVVSHGFTFRDRSPEEILAAVDV
jgi:hypothetical protein